MTLVWAAVRETRWGKGDGEPPFIMAVNEQLLSFFKLNSLSI